MAASCTLIGYKYYTPKNVICRGLVLYPAVFFYAAQTGVRVLIKINTQKNIKRTVRMDLTKKNSKYVKWPIRGSLLIIMIGMFGVLCVLIYFLSSVFFSSALYAQYDSKLTGVVTYIEHNVDADDMKTCIQTGQHSEKYDETQLFLNKMIDDLGFEYIYIVIPKDTVMVNVISATSAAEFAAGEDNLPLLDEGDWYTPEELEKYSSLWNTDGVNFFEETDSYGGESATRYVACKTMRDSDGNPVALICADLDSTVLHASVTKTVVISLLIVAAVFVTFGTILGIWLNRNVSDPLRKLEASAYKFASEKSGSDELKYDAPSLRIHNEVGSLAEAIKKMTSDIDVYIKDRDEAEMKIHIAEEENIRLTEQAEAAAKIAELSQSVSDLLNNMPALTFYKEKESGKYLGCNQAFALYAGKNAPSEVVGLTDFDLFTEKDAKHFLEIDNIVMGLDHPYIILETAIDANGVERTFQTTKLKFRDATGEERLLGMCMDLTEMASVKHESEKTREAYETAMSASITYSGIARALSTDYTYIYYVNIETDEYIEYRNELSKEALTEEKRGTDFFAASRKDAQIMLHKDDRQVFSDTFTKENVIEKIDATGAFTFTYRLLIDGAPNYVNMKATRIKDDPYHIIIGVSNVDAQMKDKEALERLQEEKITYERISALSGDFICIYTVDPKTNRYSEYIIKNEYEKLGIDREGDDFFAAPLADNAGVIWEEDREMFLSMMTKENVIKEIKEHGLFTLNYRILINNAPVYVMMKAAMVEEKDGPQLVVGISNIDEQVKREKEYAYNLSVARSQANVDALTGVKNKHAYIDAEAALNAKIEKEEPVEFAIIVFDVNGLKTTNDTQGHNAGDELLRSACGIICKTFKHSPVFRVGGDEFTVIAKGGDYEDLDALVELIAKTHRKNKETGGAVVACGAARYTNEKSAAEVFEKADVAMYENKRALKQTE